MSTQIHRARKRFGQNFLCDRQIIERIVAAIAPKEHQQLVEIGPGQGALTSELLAANPQLTAIEIDRDLAAQLNTRFAQYPDFKLIEGDALKADYRELADVDKPLRLVGNLPYNLSTPLLFHLLGFGDLITDMHFMLQKEVVDRMAAAPGSKTYGRLSVMVQYRCAVQPLFQVPPTAFKPAPKVESMIVRLVPRAKPALVADNIPLFENMVNTCFQLRRKTLRNCLKPLLQTEQLDALQLDTLKISLSARPDTLSVNDFVSLSNRINSLL
ncbi:MAG: 16S rRNA (adenine(1518)-N(6)/adenine(1519)-N(6))-dimethyltransferase RsmA [Porticoccaceae bacterium]